MPLGVPVPLIAPEPGLEPDLARTTTGEFELAKTERGPAILPLTTGKLRAEIFWKGREKPSVYELDVAEPPLPADAEVSDVKPPVPARPLVWPWLLGGALAAAAAYAYKRLRGKPGSPLAPAPPVDTRTPQEIALADLAALEPLWTEGKHREFYFRLTETLRAYLERRYAVPALKLTTHELARVLRDNELDRAAQTAFRGLFDRADLVKFAKVPPEAGQGPLDLETARRFVAATAPPPPRPAQGARA